MKVIKKNFRCMHGHDAGDIYQCEVESTHGSMYGHIYALHTTIFRGGSSMESKFPRLRRYFGEISSETREHAQAWCDKWLPLVKKYCTHKDHEFRKDGYGMSITITNRYAYYSIIRFSEREDGDIYPAVTAYLYKNVKKYFGFIPIGQQVTPECLETCYADAVKAWDLIAGEIKSASNNGSEEEK